MFVLCAQAVSVSLSKNWCIPVSNCKSRHFPKLGTVMLGPLSLPCDAPCECIILGHDP